MVSGGPPRGGEADQSPVSESLAHEEAALLAPVRAGDMGSGDVADRHCGAAFHRDLIQLGAGDEADPVPVRREERHGRPLRPGELGGGRLIQAADEQLVGLPEA